jgi:hypothetical protein
MRDVDVGMRAVIGRGHALAVLPHTEDQRQQEYQSAASRVILVSMAKCQFIARPSLVRCGFRVAD